MYRITNSSDRALHLPVNYGDGLTTLVLGAGKSEDVHSFGGVVDALKEQKLLEVVELPAAPAVAAVVSDGGKSDSRADDKSDKSNKRTS